MNDKVKLAIMESLDQIAYLRSLGMHRAVQHQLYHIARMITNPEEYNLDYIGYRRVV